MNFSSVLNYSPGNISALNPITWDSAVRYTLFIQVGGLLTNGSLVYLFRRHRSLFTPFTIYIFNLCLVNLGCCLLFYPVETINDLYDSWWLGSTLCTWYQYITYMFDGSMCNAHALIALNREQRPIDFALFTSRRCLQLKTLKSNRGILGLSLMTFSELVLYCPVGIYYTLVLFNVNVPSEVYAVVADMFELTAVLDPIWFIFALKDIRHQFRQTFFSCQG
ncbi:hypothetical protein RvY_06630 [Ramazzottius varieornatus]|uniref:G-protein coupled receptors family 1 profile domain-containing protein n=1 Tax=Ramazzottius varieornatus TaxID=947166 RepID=A0A1D1V4Q2_RAMVA|nr:hypothetical protein RvY_06630 [Ramazzottius varieornatus]